MTQFAVLLGPVLIGVLTAYTLFGVYMVQLYHYALNDCIPAARTQLHILVGLVTVSEVTNMVFITLSSWRVLVGGVKRPDLILIPPATSIGTPILNGVTACFVQCFFAWRITRLSGTGFKWVRYTIPPLVVAIALLQLSAACATGAKFLQLHRQFVLVYRLKLPVTLYLSASLACDSLITISMIYILLNFKAATELSTTKRLLNWLIFHAVENGAITTVCAALNLAFYIGRPQDAIQFTFQFIIGRLYANVLLANLNGRGRRGTDTAPSSSTGGKIAFCDMGREASAVFSTDSNPRSALYSLTAPKMRAKTEGDDGLRDRPGVFRLGRKRRDKSRSPSPTFRAPTATEVYRGEDIMSRPTSGYFDVLGRPLSGGSSTLAH